MFQWKGSSPALLQKLVLPLKYSQELIQQKLQRHDNPLHVLTVYCTMCNDTSAEGRRAPGSLHVVGGCHHISHEQTLYTCLLIVLHILAFLVLWLIGLNNL